MRGGATLLIFAIGLIGAASAEEMQKSDPGRAVAYFSELFDQYPNQKVASEMIAILAENLESGQYESLKTREDLAKALTADVRSVRRDFHLGVQYAATSPVDDAAHNLDKPEVLDGLRKKNFGFEEARILEGNVAFIKITALNDVSVAGDTARYALGFASNADAVIIDIRGNLGGEPNMVRLLESAFFEKRTLMNTIYYTDGRDDAVEEIWTDPQLVGIEKLYRTPVFILISRFVASGAEDLAYSMQAQGRATIVGTQTLGAAHPGMSHYREDLRLSFSMPHGYVVNPITGTDWEGVGVVPDVEVPDGASLREAKAQAWKAIGYEAALAN